MFAFLWLSCTAEYYEIATAPKDAGLKLSSSSVLAAGCKETFTSNKITVRYLFNNKKGSPRPPPKAGETLCFMLNLAHLSHIQLKSNYGGNMFRYVNKNGTEFNATDIYPTFENGITSKYRSIKIYASPNEDPKEDSFIDIDSFPIYYLRQSNLSNQTNQTFGLNSNGKSGTFAIVIVITIIGIIFSVALTIFVTIAAEDFC